MRALKATAVFAATTLGVAVLSSASSMSAATDGLSSESLLAGADMEAAFSGSARVTEDPDAPIRTGRWAEDTAPVELAGGPAQVAAAAPEPILLSRPNATVPAPEQPRMAVLDSRLTGPAPTSAAPVPLSRVSWAPASRQQTYAPAPRIDLTISDQNMTAPGAGLDISSSVFSEPLAIARSGRPVFDVKRLTLRVGPSESVRKKGRWFVFAAGSGEAFGLNLVRDPLRGWRPAGWSVEQLAEFGKAQLGIGWRRGAQQVSVSAARREISAYGVSREDTILGITFSVSGKPPAQTRYEQRLPRAR